MNRPRTILALLTATLLAIVWAAGPAAAVAKSTSWKTCAVNNRKDYEVRFFYNSLQGPSSQLTGYQFRIRSGIGVNPAPVTRADVSVSGPPGKTGSVTYPNSSSATTTLYGWPAYTTPELAVIYLRSSAGAMCGTSASLPLPQGWQGMTRAHGHPQYRRNQATLARQARNTDAPCARCGQPINYTPPTHLHPTAFTAGHIIAVAQGGTHDLDNLQPEHRACNLRAGSRLGARRARKAAPPAHPSPPGW